ncbi:hypothetical protein D910_07014 [Dendroctonus ponderosae]|uniref:Uncharacterized protein n=1 Tax=Dendroctonus ponderosae TaxID=77166 RepID=U4U6X1_DENPD|nr:hypothetical protein D910_07014 [Dendroctonus ponderosae]
MTIKYLSAVCFRQGRVAKLVLQSLRPEHEVAGHHQLHHRVPFVRRDQSNSGHSLHYQGAGVFQVGGGATVHGVPGQNSGEFSRSADYLGGQRRPVQVGHDAGQRRDTGAQGQDAQHWLQRGHLVPHGGFCPQVTNGSNVYWFNLTSRQQGKLGDVGSVDSIAVDWIGRKLYWSNLKQQLVGSGPSDDFQSELSPRHPHLLADHPQQPPRRAAGAAAHPHPGQRDPHRFGQWLSVLVARVRRGVRPIEW